MRGDELTDLPFRFGEAHQLNQALRALCSVLNEELDSAMADPTQAARAHGIFVGYALCLSALLHLFDLYMCAELHGLAWIGAPGYDELQRTAIIGMQDCTAETLEFAQKVEGTMPTSPCPVNPLVADCLYLATAKYEWYTRETDSETCTRALETLMRILQTIGRAWKVGGSLVESLL
jgi:hypothetical protein